MMRRRVLLAAVTAAIAKGSAATEPARAEITIDNFTFAPPALTVAAGTAVTWVNHDDIPHQLVGSADAGVINSPVLDTDESFTATFATPGTYGYFCSMHPHMQGTVIVR